MQMRQGQRSRYVPRRLIVPVMMAVLFLTGLGFALVTAPAEEARARSMSPAAQRRLTARQVARIELGRRLFFEPLASRSGNVSCASCHAPDHGFSDPDAVSLDDAGTTPRHSQTLVDSAFNPSVHWDGEFGSVEELVARRLGTSSNVYYTGRTPRRPFTPRRPPTVTPRVIARADGNLLDTHTLGKPARRTMRKSFPLATTMTSGVPGVLARDGRYAEAFKAAFGDAEPTLERLAISIAAYCYTLDSTASAFDRYRQGDTQALSPSAKRGMLLFEGRAGCAECHLTKGEHPLLTDFAFHNTGIVHEAIQVHTGELLLANADGRMIRTPLRPREGRPRIADRGLARLTRQTTHERAFKTPTLRDVTRRGPYMHDGRFETLEEVVLWYAAGCGTDPQKDHRLNRFTCSEQDTRDLVAFLHALEGHERPGLAKKAWKKRAGRTRLRVVQGDQPVADLEVKLVPVGDPQPIKRGRGDRALTLRTDSRGEVVYTPPARTHMRVVLPDDIPVTNSPLVPDTCREATVQVPLAGRMTFVVTFPKDLPAPPVLIAQHPTAPVSSAQPRRARTLFRRGEVVELKDGRVAKYKGWVRSDIPKAVTLKMPGMTRNRRNAQMRHAHLSLMLEAGTTRRIDLTAN